MAVLSDGAISELCSGAGISIRDTSPEFNRELTYCNGPARTIVIHVVEGDFPDHVTEILSMVLRLSTRWIVLNRYGHLQANEFVGNKVSDILGLLAGIPSRSGGEDRYLLSKCGSVILAYDHHLLDDGIGIYFGDVSLAGRLLTWLNEIGAEVELYSKKRLTNGST